MAVAETTDAQLSIIAKYAYGSGITEKKRGGEGNIGLLNGRVVKFNTHWYERGGTVTAGMKQCCDALRLRLYELAQNVSNDAAFKADIGSRLGIANGRVITTELLDRKTVASVITELEARSKKDFFTATALTDNSDVPAVINLSSLASTFKSTSFKNVVHREAERYAEIHKVGLKNMLDDLVRNVLVNKDVLGYGGKDDGGKDDGGKDDECKKTIRSIVRKSIEPTLFWHRVITRKTMKAELSTYFALHELSSRNWLTKDILETANELSPFDANLFLNRELVKNLKKESNPNADFYEDLVVRLENYSLDDMTADDSQMPVKEDGIFNEGHPFSILTDGNGVSEMPSEFSKRFDRNVDVNVEHVERLNGYRVEVVRHYNYLAETLKNAPKNLFDREYIQKIDTLSRLANDTINAFARARKQLQARSNIDIESSLPTCEETSRLFWLAILNFASYSEGKARNYRPA